MEKFFLEASARKEYPLFYTRPHYLAYTGLQKEIEKTNNNTQRLIVYPRITHFPSRDKQAFISFQLVGFDKGGHSGVAGELKDNEFKLCGLWQFIPVCRTPCVSIFRNFNKERLDYIKQAEPATKALVHESCSHTAVVERWARSDLLDLIPKLARSKGDLVLFQSKLNLFPAEMFGALWKNWPSIGKKHRSF